MAIGVDSLSRHRAYAEIRNLIRSGRLAPDEPLSERHLSELLKIGRMPIREAMQALANEGLLKIVPTRGTFVRRLTVNELRDLYEVRQAIEGLAAYLTALRGVSEELSSYRAIFERASAASDAAELLESQREGARFHEAVSAGSGNAELAGLLIRLRDKVELSMRITSEHDLGRIRASADEHLSILNAIEQGNGDLARQLMVSHLARSYEARLKIFGGHSIRVPYDQEPFNRTAVGAVSSERHS